MSKENTFDNNLYEENNQLNNDSNTNTAVVFKNIEL